MRGRSSGRLPDTEHKLTRAQASPHCFIVAAPPAFLRLWKSPPRVNIFQRTAKEIVMALDHKTRTELEAAAFRRLLEHLRLRADVQNIDMMNLAGFCRNCLSNWMKEAADSQGVSLTKDESREAVYGMPFDEWKAKHQKDASSEQKAAFEKASHKH
jgi:hypothetical protein